MQNLPRPIEDYLIGKYDNGTCVYLITKEAFKNWHNHGASVRHLCFNNNNNQALTEYSLAPGRYTAYEFNNCSQQWKELMMKSNPALYEELFSKKAVKSKPTPDQYCLVNYPTSPSFPKEWFIILRTCLEHVKKVDRLTESTIGWGSYAGTCVTHNCFVKSSIVVRKFPQLSSEVKAELQKQNPERYKEWEEFYMRKYPTLMPLQNNDTILPNPATDYLFCSGPSGWCLVRKSEYTQSAKVALYDLNCGWGEGHVSHPKRYLEFSLHGPFSNCKAWVKIADKFKQYYAKQAEKIPPTDKFSHIIPSECTFLTYDNGCLYIVPTIEFNDPNKKEIPPHVISAGYKLEETLVRRGSVDTKAYYKYEHYKFNNLPQGLKDIFKQYVPELYKHFEDFYRRTEATAYIKGWLELKSQKQLQAYHSLQQKVYDYSDVTAQKQQNYSPNLKQQNNETIIVCRKIKPVIRQQIIRGTTTSSNRIKPSITGGYIVQSTGTIYGKKKS